MTTNKPQDASQTTRRSVLQAGALATGALALNQPLAAAATPRRRGSTKVTVVLFQHGGADHLNLYAPTGDLSYATLRPTTAIGAPGSSNPVVGRYMDPMFSMHPVMTGTHQAFSAHQSDCAIVHAVGYSPFSRSHFASMDLYETALAGVQSGGWINRHLQATASLRDVQVRALALMPSLPMSMTGDYTCYAVSSTAELVSTPNTGKLFLDKIVHGTAIQQMLPEQRATYQAQRDSFALFDTFSVLDPANYTPANGATYPSTHIGHKLRQIAEVIKADLGVEFFGLEHHGWDHHSDLVMRIEGHATNLDQSVTAFFDDLGQLADDVILVTMSEFGRTAAENGSGGTDHGVGGAMMLRGGAVQGGQVYGNWPGLAPSQLLDGHSLAATTDFRDVLREILDTHMGGTDPSATFPGHIYQPVGAL
jgi:uncharacterized protein (DUF1501 family)